MHEFIFHQCKSITFALMKRIKTHYLLIQYLFIVSIYGSISSCNSFLDETGCVLHTVEQCMEAHPDSALCLLESIPQPQQLKDEYRANYYLLLTQARDKNYMDLSTDSSINYSVMYFKEKDNTSKYGKSMYYYGRVIQMCGDYPRALKIFLDAQQSLEDAKEYKILGLMSEDISIINRSQSFYDKAIHHSRDAILYYYLAKDTLGVAYAHQTLATAFFLNQQIDSTRKYTKQSLHLLKANPLKLKVGANKLFGLACSFQKEYLQAEFYFLKVLNENPNNKSRVHHYLSLGHLYQMMGRHNEAKEYLDKCIQSDKLNVRSEAYSHLSQIAISENKLKDALYYKQLSDSLQYIVENETKKTELVEIDKKHLVEKYTDEKFKTESKNRILYSIFLTILTLIIFILFILYEKYNSAKRQLSKNQKYIESNRNKINQYKKRIESYKRQQTELATSFEDEIKILNDKIADLSIDTRNFISKIDIEVLIKMLKNGDIVAENITAEEWKRIYNLTNSLFHNALISLKTKHPRLTDHDIEILSFMLLGFSPKEMIILFDSKSGHTLSKAKLRLKERLELKKGDSLDNFVKNCREGKTP